MNQQFFHTFTLDFKSNNQLEFMNKITLLIFLFLVLISCQKNKHDLKLELLTNEIVCAEDVKKDDFFEIRYIPNAIYDSLSKNILHYKITNISDKKYFIMLNENQLGTLEHDYYREAIGKKSYSLLNSIDLSLYKNDSVLDGSSTRLENMCGNGFELMRMKDLDTIVNEFVVKNKILRKYKIQYINDIDDTLQGYFLQPGETKYFTSIVNLPYRNGQQWFSNIDTKKPNQGSLSLRNDSVYTKKRMSKNQKREIEENGYALFDGKIYSNRVPVKLIKIKN